MPKLSDYLTVAEAAQVLGVSKDTLRRWDKAGKLTARRHPVTRYRLYLRKELDAFLRHVSSDATSNATLPPGCLPFLTGLWSKMWCNTDEIKVRLDSFQGPVVRLDITDTFLGEYALLALPESATARFGLTVRDRLDRFELLDSDGVVRAVFRCWWQLGADDYRGEAYPSLVGCELLGDPSIVDRLNSASAHDLTVWSVVQRQTLGEDRTEVN